MINAYYKIQENCLPFEVIMSIIFSSFFLILSFFYSPTYDDIKNSQYFFDCHSINVTQFEFNNSRILLKAKLDNFYQYPKSFAPVFLKMKLQTGNIGLDFNYSHYYDLLNDKENLSFCALISIGGQIQADLYCDTRKIKSTTTHLTNINYYPIGTTKILPSYSHLFDFSDACLTNDQFYLFQRNPINFPAFKFSVDKTLTPVVFGNNIHDFILKKVSFDGEIPVIKKYDKSLVYDERYTIILPSQSKFPFFNILLPILEDYNDNQNKYSKNYENFHFMIYSLGETDFIKYQLGINDNLVSNGTSRCFSQGSFAKTIEGNSPFFENQKYSFFDYWLTNPSLNKLRSFYHFPEKSFLNHENQAQSVLNISENSEQYSKKTLKIVFEDGIEEKIFFVKSELAKNKTIKIKNISISMDSPKIAKIMKNADIFVACSIPGLLMSGFLRKNSTIVKINPDNAGNDEYLYKIGKTLGIKTFSVPGPSNQCHNLKCIYESFSFQQTSDDDILKTIHQALLFMNK